MESHRPLTLIRPGGGGVESTPPPLDVSRDNSAEFFSRAPRFRDFFLLSLAQLLTLFLEKSGVYRSEVTQRYVIERRLKIREFSGFVYKTYGKWLFVLKIHFGL